MHIRQVQIPCCFNKARRVTLSTKWFSPVELISFKPVPFVYAYRPTAIGFTKKMATIAGLSNQGSAVDENPFGETGYNGENYKKSRQQHSDLLFAELKKLLKREPGSAGSSAQSIAVDIGCGPGVATIPLADVADKVFGVDSSTQQLQAAPSHPRVEYIQCSALESMNSIEQHSARLVFYGQSLHWVGVENGSKISKYLLSIKEPSLMAIGGYHYGYIVNADTLPNTVLDFINNDTNKMLPYEEILPVSFYANEPSLTKKEYYKSNREATDTFQNFVHSLPWASLSELKENEYQHCTFPFKYQKRLYSHGTTRMTLEQLISRARTWSPFMKLSVEERESRINDFAKKMRGILSLKSNEEDVILCSIWYCKLLSDNCDFEAE